MVTLLTFPDRLPYDETSRQSLSVREGGITATRYIQFDGSREYEYAQAFRGLSRWDVGNNLISRKLPEMHPKWSTNAAGPNGSGLPCTSFEFVRELGEPSQSVPAGNALIFSKVEYAATYERSDENHGVLYLLDGDRPAGQQDELWRYVHRRIEYEAHGIVIPRNVLEFVAPLAGPHDPVPEPGVQLVFEATVYLTWLSVPAYYPQGSTAPQLPGALEANIGKCVLRTNSVKFDQTWAPLTALALAPKRTLKTQADGSFAWDLMYPFAIRGGPDLSAGALDGSGTDTPDWTRLIRQAGNYWKVRRKSAPTKSIYDAVDLSYLFRLDAMP